MCDVATLRIVRESGYADRMRSYQIVLDGSTICTIARGESKVLPIAPGDHSIKARIDWCESNTERFRARPEESVTFRVRSNLTGARLAFSIWYVLFDRKNYLVIERVHESISAT